MDAICSREGTGSDGGLKADDDESVYSFMVFKDEVRSIEDAKWGTNLKS
jgi:hypothetical protein